MKLFLENFKAFSVFSWFLSQFLIKKRVKIRFTYQTKQEFQQIFHIKPLSYDTKNRIKA